MAEPVLLALTGVTQGAIAGEGPGGAIACVAFEGGGDVPRADAGGFARRRYVPLTITKRLDEATPLISAAFVSGEQVSGTFSFTRRVGGDVETFFTITISKARVTSTHCILPDVLSPATSSLVPLERVGFAFDHIEWTSKGGRTATDDGILA
jgi:type VI secretion system secreted protein Hcp